MEQVEQKEKRGNFDDMEDDIPFDDESRDLKVLRKDGVYMDTFDADMQRIQENRRKNSNRKYKPQKGRMMLLMCDRCDWKCRLSNKHRIPALGKKCLGCDKGTLFAGDDTEVEWAGGQVALTNRRK